jgi:hypothetical protein
MKKRIFEVFIQVRGGFIRLREKLQAFFSPLGLFAAAGNSFALPTRLLSCFVTGRHNAEPPVPGAMAPSTVSTRLSQTAKKAAKFCEIHG